MPFERTLIIIVLFSAAINLFVLTFAIWERRSTSGRAALFFSLELAAITIYTFGYGMELTNNTLEDVERWVRFEHFGIQMITPLWVLFTLHFTGREKLITPVRTVILFIWPVIMLYATQTLGTLNLAHPNPHLDTVGPFSTFDYTRGVFLYIGAAYYNVCLFTCMVLFTIHLIRSAPAFRPQAWLFWIGSLIPFIAQLVYNLGLSPYNIDLTPFALTISGVIFSLGLFRFHILDILPLARDVIFDSFKDGVMVLDLANRIIDMNISMQKMLPGVSKSMIGQPVGEALAEYPTLLELINKGQSGSVEIDIKKQGISSSLNYLGTLSTLRDAKNNRVGRIVTIHDNTQARQLLIQLEELAARDSLTGIYNRRSFDQLAAQNIYTLRETGGMMAVIMLDLDFFKRVNDTYSHTAGDLALKKVTETCHSLLRQGDILSRYGGEEFVIFLPDTDEPAAAAIAERLREGIARQAITFEERTFSLTASFGVASTICNGLISLDELVHQADQAVYQAKQQGRNRVCVCRPPD
jgi:diguanylate cyclase (GGDEF)-like protein